MKFSVPLLVVVAFSLLVSACATKEYRQEESACEAVWLQQMPPNYQQRTVEKFRSVQVPTGEVRCQSIGTTTRCRQIMTTQLVPYTALETVDVAKPGRDANIDQCAEERCLKKFGNRECKKK